MFINFLDHTSALFTAVACALVLAAAAPGVLAQQSAGDTLEDTVWVTEGGPIGGALVFELQRGGVFRATSLQGMTRTGTWKQEGASVHIRVRGASTKYEGTFEGGRLGGTATDGDGRSRPWSTRRQEARPVPASAVAPRYPPIAGAARAEGVVMVEAKVDKAGHVSSASALNGHPLLQQSAVGAAKQWQFDPVEGAETRTVRLFFVYQMLPQDCLKRRPDPAPRFSSGYQVTVWRRRGCLDID